MELEIQKAIYDKLKSSGTLMAVITGVYDHVPQKTTYPYVAIGEDTAIPWDSNDTTGIDATLTIHIWSRKAGRKEVKQIMKIIYDLLHRDTLDVVGYNTVTVEWEWSESFVDPDGVTRHGVVRYRIIANKEA